MCSSLLPLPTAILFFFFNDTATTEIYTLSLHDALPISSCRGPAMVTPARAARGSRAQLPGRARFVAPPRPPAHPAQPRNDRKVDIRTPLTAISRHPPSASQQQRHSTGRTCLSLSCDRVV